MPRRAPEPGAFTMSFGDHLEELRKRILLALAAPLPLFIIVFFFSDTLIAWLLLPVFDVLGQHGLPSTLQVLSPPELLLTKLKLSAITALVLTAPWLLWQGWLFVAPGLYQHERRFVYLLLPGSGLLTIAGIALLYLVMLPLMLHVLIAVSANLELPAAEIDPRIEVSLEAVERVPIVTGHPVEPKPGDVWLLVPDMELHAAVADEDGNVETLLVPPRHGGVDQRFRVSFVINFALVLMLGVAVAFQMPLVIVLLGWLGIVGVPWLRAQRRYAIAICGVLAAVITPADAASMLIMLVPLYGLYELGILLLLLLPASVVAEGRWPWRRRLDASPPPDKALPASAGGPDQGIQAAHPERSAPTTASAGESGSDTTDGQDDDTV